MSGQRESGTAPDRKRRTFRKWNSAAAFALAESDAEPRVELGAEPDAELGADPDAEPRVEVEYHRTRPVIHLPPGDSAAAR